MALAILGIAMVSLSSVSHSNRLKSERSIHLGRLAALARGKLAEILLGPAPTAPEETDWSPFLDESGARIEEDLAWRKAVTEIPFAAPETGQTLAGRSLWEIRLSIAPAEDPEGQEAVTVTAWMESPPGASE